MITILALASIAAGLVIGLVANKRTTLPGGNGLSISDIVGQALTLAVLFLAFILVGSAESYGRAHQAAVNEAGVVDHIFELGQYVPPEQRQQIQGAMVCYARAVVAHEWWHMDQGRSSVASSWSTRVRDTFAVAARTSPTVFSLLDSADQQRSSARQNRITEENTATPALVSGLMIVTLAGALAGYAFYVPWRRAHIACLFGLALILAATLTVVADLERPFSGQIRIEPVAMLDSARDIADDYSAAFGVNTLPCDETGRALPGR